MFVTLTERRRKRRQSRQNDHQVKRPRRLKLPTAYNLFCSEMFRDDRTLPCSFKNYCPEIPSALCGRCLILLYYLEIKTLRIADKNRALGKRWKELPVSDRDQFQARAEAIANSRTGKVTAWNDANCAFRCDDWRILGFDGVYK